MSNSGTSNVKLPGPSVLQYQGLGHGIALGKGKRWLSKLPPGLAVAGAPGEFGSDERAMPPEICQKVLILR